MFGHPNESFRAVTIDDIYIYLCNSRLNARNPPCHCACVSGRPIILWKQHVWDMCPIKKCSREELSAMVAFPPVINEESIICSFNCPPSSLSRETLKWKSHENGILKRLLNEILSSGANLYILEIHVTLHLLSQFFPLNPCAQTHLKRFGPWLRQVAPFRHGLESHTDTIAVAEKRGGEGGKQLIQFQSKTVW